MLDKNLFLYDLAIVAIFKDEARYLKEWLDYHLLAGVEHFYLYNNDSSDDYKKILAPYVENNLVTLTDFPGKVMQLPVYNDAIEKFRFEARYFAFIDIDEFIFPKTNRAVAEVVDEVLSRNDEAAALVANWQLFGSNGQDKADYSRGVLERFTRRASKDFVFLDGEGNRSGNFYVKTIANPRLIKCSFSPHHAAYVDKKFAVNSDGNQVSAQYNDSVHDDKIVVNHYCIKSLEEFISKQNRSLADGSDPLNMNYFITNDHNEVFDDGILKYRDARADKFSLESDEHRISRVVNALVKNLTAEEISFETSLTCRYLAEKFDIKIGEHSAEEIALALIYRILVKGGILTFADAQFFIDVLPEIISRPFPLIKDIVETFSARYMPGLIAAAKNSGLMEYHKNLRQIKRLLDSIKL